MTSDTLYDLDAIQRILPHRSPFLFVDRVTALTPGRVLVAHKDLDPDAPFFRGHFPGRPIMPGVLVSEALAQAGGLLVALSAREPTQRPSLFLARVDIKFTSPARPPETLRLEARLKKAYGGLFLLDVAATVDTRAVAAGSLALAEE